MLVPFPPSDLIFFIGHFCSCSSVPWILFCNAVKLTYRVWRWEAVPWDWILEVKLLIHDLLTIERHGYYGASGDFSTFTIVSWHLFRSIFIGFKIVRAVKFSCVSEKYSLMVLFKIVRSKSLQLMIYPLGYFLLFSFYWGCSNCERGTFWKIAHNLLWSQFVIFFIVFEKKVVIHSTM